jgi:polar amino acid transport system substrate-binding protein
MNQESRHTPNPTLDAAKMIVVYLSVGLLWILLSDRLLSWLVSDPTVVAQIQLYKGWFYVIVTAIVFFVIIRRRIGQYKEAFDRANRNIAELDEANQRLQEAETELVTIAYSDPLTRLANRTMLEATVADLINRSRDEEIRFALLYFDIDNFKHINETMGHETGDRLLQAIAQDLKADIAEENTFARLGGDDFAIVIQDVRTEADAISRAQRLLSRVRRQWEVGRDSFFVTLSVGIVLYPKHGATFSELLQNADSAVYVAKESGRDRMAVYNDSMRDKTVRLLEMTTLLRGAIASKHFRLYYQPIVAMDDARIIGYEALIRWIHPERGMIAPLEFIGFAERTGLITPIEEWVFKEAFEQARKWHFDEQRKHISINLSAVSLLRDGFVEWVEGMLEETLARPEWFELEVTETAVMTDIGRATDTLERLRRLGFLIALDDFGTGYSSLTYLRRLPIQILKIDRSFLPLTRSEGAPSQILTSIVRLAHEMKLQVVAEGVETEEQAQMLKQLGCDLAQGFYYGRPQQTETLEVKYRE